MVDLYAGGRLPAWPTLSTFDRRSPGNDADNARRRTRARHTGPRTSPSSRSFNGPAANGSSQNPQRPPSLLGSGPGRENIQPLTPRQQYYMGPSAQPPSHNGRHPAGLSGPSAGPNFDIHLPSPSFYSHVGTQPDPFQNPLAGVNPAMTGDNFRGTTSHARTDQIPPLSPTIGGPEVDMINSEPATPRRASSHQHL